MFVMTLNHLIVLREHLAPHLDTWRDTFTPGFLGCAEPCEASWCREGVLLAGTSEEEATPLLELPGLTSDSAKEERDSAEEYLGRGDRREDRPTRPRTRLLFVASRVAP